MREITLYPGESITLADGTRVVAIDMRSADDAGADSAVPSPIPTRTPIEKLSAWYKADRGRAERLAAVIGVSASYLSQMASGYRPISTERCVLIEAETRKQVTRQDMRPHDFWKHWPDLAAPVKDQTDA